MCGGAARMGKKPYYRAFSGLLTYHRHGRVSTRGEAKGLFRAPEKDCSEEFRDYSEEKQMSWDSMP